MRIDFVQVITQIISFLLMFWILKRFAWEHILVALNTRKQKIQLEYDSIAEQKNKIDELISEYQTKLKELDIYAQLKIQKAVEEAKLQAQNIHLDAQEQARNILIKAQEDTQREIQKAQAQLKQEIVGITMGAIEKVLQGNLDENNQKDILNGITDYVEAH
ncbi:MAG: F0F1 ATP synthase subunit B [Parachlamydiaceae bacterium]|nr:F0F1 ATP synthase subunit B [Parachlamydiaceae bacterium]